MKEEHQDASAGPSLHHGHLLHDTSFRFISVNPTACAMLGYSEAEMLQMSLADIEPDFDQHGIRDRLLAMRNGELLHTRGRPRHRDGHLVPVEVSVSALDADGQRLFVVVLSTRSEPQVLLNDTLSHELNNTAQAMLGLLDDIRQRQRAQAPPSLKDVAVLSFVTRQLLSLSNTFQQRAAEPTQPTPLHALVSNTLEAVRRSGELDQIDVVHLPPLRELRVQINPPRIERVVLNLVRNAAQAMAGAPQKRLTIRYSEEAGRVRCQFFDTGEGVPAALGERIFAPGVSTRDDGTRRRGYGLSIARESVRVYGGELTAAPAPGGGACFTMSLPLCP